MARVAIVSGEDTAAISTSADPERKRVRLPARTLLPGKEKAPGLPGLMGNWSGKRDLNPAK
jgi:hypothetical protein